MKKRANPSSRGRASSSWWPRSTQSGIVLGALAVAGWLSGVTHAEAASTKADQSFFRPGSNLAQGKPYTFSPAPVYRYCTDPGDRRQLTDGVYTSGYFWTQKSTVGWQRAKPVLITVDLGQAEPICGASFNTAAGVAGVHWPVAIYLLVSDDGQSSHEAGELIDLSRPHGPPPRAGYATHRYWTDALRTHGRLVTFVVIGTPYVFADEIEIYRGNDSWLSRPWTGETVTDATAFARARQVCEAVARRVRADAQAVRSLSTQAVVSAVIQSDVAAQLARVEAAVPDLPQRYGPDFRAVLPLNALHAQVFRAQAALWRAAGAAPWTIWQSGVWDPLPLIGWLPRDTNAAVDVALMQNEFRVGAFNVSNSGQAEETLALRIVGLPGGDNPSWITVHEVQWTDTQSGQPVAAALPEAKRVDGAFAIRAPAGLTRQVWLTFHPENVPPGLHHGRILLSGPAAQLEVPLRVRVYPMRFPDHPALHLGGWDYTDVERRYEINPQNRAQVIAHLREHFVDSPWATAAVWPPGNYDAQDRLVAPPDTARFDEWLRRWPKAGQYCVFASVGPGFAGAGLGTASFEKRVGAWIRFWAEHVRQRGLQPKQLAILLVDEPHSAEQDATILAWSRAIRAAQTGMRIWEDPTHSNPAQANQEMMAACDVLCPNRPRFLANPEYHEYFAEHRPSGTALAFYSCSGPVRLLDPYSYHRLQAWSCWRYGAKSSYYWAFGDSGGGSSWNEYAAPGTAYVPFFLDATSVTPGKHFEAIREGVEDYEYLAMLQSQVAGAEEKGLHSAALRRARQLLKDAAAQVCNAPGAQSLMWAEAKNRSVADQVRIKILDALTELSSGDGR